MNYRDSDEECGGCGSTAAARARNQAGAQQGLSDCPHCGATKCCLCDLGDDVECGNCDLGEDE